MPGFTNYAANGALTSYFIANGKYLGLHSADPTNTGNPATELNGGGYARLAISWTAASNRTTANSNQLAYYNLPAATVKFMAVWDALTSGNCLHVISVTPNVVVAAGGTFVVPVNDITVTVP